MPRSSQRSAAIPIAGEMVRDQAERLKAIQVLVAVLRSAARNQDHGRERPAGRRNVQRTGQGDGAVLVADFLLPIGHDGGGLCGGALEHQRACEPRLLEVAGQTAIRLQRAVKLRQPRARERLEVHFGAVLAHHAQRDVLGSLARHVQCPLEGGSAAANVHDHVQCLAGDLERAGPLALDTGAGGLGRGRDLSRADDNRRRLRGRGRGRRLSWGGQGRGRDGRGGRLDRSGGWLGSGQGRGSQPAAAARSGPRP